MKDFFDFAAMHPWITGFLVLVASDTLVGLFNAAFGRRQ